jgi:hypothetical protein
MALERSSKGIHNSVSFTKADSISANSKEDILKSEFSISLSTTNSDNLE